MQYTSYLVCVLAAATAVPQANAYTINGDTVKCYIVPDTIFPAVKTYNKDQNILITCQTAGPSVNGNILWDRTSDGCFVADYYVSTSTGDSVPKKCASSSPSPGMFSYCKMVNQAGLDLILKWERFTATPKPTPRGFLAVGYGHLCQRTSCTDVKYKFPLTKATAQQLLKDDITVYSSCLAIYLNSSVKLNDNQWAALVSWVENIGCGNAKDSKLVKRLNSGDDPNTVAAQELPKWRKANGNVSDDLVKRRADEVNLFKTASSKQAYPGCQ